MRPIVLCEYFLFIICLNIAMYSKAGDAFLLLAPLRDRDYGNYPHIALIETNRTHIVHPLTFGHFEVEKILAWDETNSLV